MSRTVVLVVDDSPATLGMLNRSLEMAEFTVLVALSGQAALDLVERVTPDIVLMDAVMPGLDGFETCRRLKQKPGLSVVPVIFMTGLTETENVIHGLEAGGVDYVTKPVSPDEMVARIRVHLADARLTRSARVALDTSGRYLIAVTPDGRVLWTTPQATALVDCVGGSAGTQMPPPVVAWLHGCIGGESGARTGPTVTKWQGYGEALQLSFIGQVGPDELLLRVVGSSSVDEEAVLHNRLPLTSREAEVLLWLSRGKANRDIAAILDLSPRTVSKHLELMFQKLGVENRASAVALAVRVLQAG